MPPSQKRKHRQCRHSYGGCLAFFYSHPAMPCKITRRRQGDDGYYCNVLIVVGHQRMFHEAHVLQSQDRRQRDAEKPPGEQQRPGPALSVSPQHGRNGQGRRKRQPPERIACFYVTLRIHENKIQRPERLVKVEPNYSACAQYAVGIADGSKALFRAVSLEPHIHRGQGHG